MAAPLGLEPKLTDPESVVLPITLQGNMSQDVLRRVRHDKQMVSKRRLTGGARRTTTDYTTGQNYLKIYAKKISYPIMKKNFALSQNIFRTGLINDNILNTVP